MVACQGAIRLPQGAIRLPQGAIRLPQGAQPPANLRDWTSCAHPRAPAHVRRGVAGRLPLAASSGVAGPVVFVLAVGAVLAAGAALGEQFRGQVQPATGQALQPVGLAVHLALLIAHPALVVGRFALGLGNPPSLGVPPYVNLGEDITCDASGSTDKEDIKNVVYVFDWFVSFTKSSYFQKNIFPNGRIDRRIVINFTDIFINHSVSDTC